MSKKQKSTTTSNSTFNSTMDQTSTPIAPAGTNEALQGLFGTLGNVRGMDPGSLVAGSNQWLDAAGDKAMNFGNDSRAALAQAQSLASQGAAQGIATSGFAGLNNWFNPYEDRVIDSALAEYDDNAGMESAAEDLQLAKSGAFAGSGGALSKVLGDRFRRQGRASLDANLRHQGFDTAAGYSSRDADRTTNVSLANAQLAEQSRQAQIASLMQGAGMLGNLDGQQIGALGGVGDVFRQIDSAERRAPVDLALLESQLAGSTTPLASLLTGQNTTGTQSGTQSGTQTTTSKVSDPMGTIGSLAMLAAAPFTGGASLGLGGLGGLFGAGSVAGGLSGMFGTAAKGIAGGKAAGLF